MALPLAQKYLFYTELAKLLEAGFGIRDAAAAMQDTRLPAQQTAILVDMERGLNEGKTIAEAFAGTQGRISNLEKSVISAGERGGRLAPAFRHLADYYGLLASAQKEAFNSMLYPILLLHLGVIVGVMIPTLSGTPETGWLFNLLSKLSPSLMEHFPSLMTWLRIGGALLGLYVGIAIVYVLIQILLKTALTNASLDSLINRIPLIGSMRRNMAMARFTKVYHICVLAGLSISECARTASTAAQSGTIREAGEQLASTAEAGGRLGPVFISSGAFPKAFARSYSTAEEAGGLDKDLARWAGLYQENAHLSAKRMADLLPKFVYMLVMLYIAWEIISFYTGGGGSPDMKALQDELNSP
jgi:type II secretory pathway component PulF